MAREEMNEAFARAANALYTQGRVDGAFGGAMGIPTPIMVWRFHEAPQAFRELSGHGGDEDWLALMPDDDYPTWVEALGVCSISEHPLPDGRLVVIGAHA